jgi:large-conductance mechanosensitive channel
MDDSPSHFVAEFRSAILKKRVGQIALAVVLAEACIRFLNSIVWFLVIPAISGLLEGHTESVLFSKQPAFPWERLVGSVIEFMAAFIFVFYVNRWVHNALPRPRLSGSSEDLDQDEGKEQVYYDLTGNPLNPTEQGPDK